MLLSSNGIPKGLPAPLTERRRRVCLLLEGTYPYVSGGVSSWTHDLIQQQSAFDFVIVSLLAPGSRPEMKYKLPKNVIEVRNVWLQELPKGKSTVPGQKRFFRELATRLKLFHESGSLESLQSLLALVSPQRGRLGSEVLLDSRMAWDHVQDVYEERFQNGSFLDFFWSWRGLHSGLYSVLLADLPDADCYHTLCTGYAGLFAARAALETGKPAILTEHGIYTNERRMELSVADWFREVRRTDLNMESHALELRDLWIETFRNYSKACYQSCRRIVTLFPENQRIQAAEGAPEAKLQVIPNGIDYDRFSSVLPDPKRKTASIALIGRVVPIKGVKSFIRACALVRRRFPELNAMILGPTSEDEGYYRECSRLVDQLELSDCVQFTGQVNVLEYLPKISLVVLASLSEAQPLVILEAGAAGIPTVATDVGACREIILGAKDETPALGPGGAICTLADPRDLADKIVDLLLRPPELARAGAAMRERVRSYYSREDQHRAYLRLYGEMTQSPVKSRSSLTEGDPWRE